MNFNRVLFFAVLSLLVSSCASTRELPTMPDYNSRDAYPDLVNDNDEVEWSFSDNPLKSSNLLDFNRVLEAYYNKLNCEATGDILVSFVVTKKARVDAPVIEKSLSENCDRSVLMSLQFLKLDEPAYVGVDPVNFLTSMNFTRDCK